MCLFCQLFLTGSLRVLSNFCMMITVTELYMHWHTCCDDHDLLSKSDLKMYSIIQYFSLSNASQINISPLDFSFNCPRYKNIIKKKKAKNKHKQKHVVPNHCQF